MTAIDLESVRPYIDILRWTKTRKKELNEIESNARAAVEDAMGDADEGLLDDEPAISWKSYKKRQLDQKALKEDHPELVEEFVQLTEVRRFEVLEP